MSPGASPKPRPACLCSFPRPVLQFAEIRVEDRLLRERVPPTGLIGLDRLSVMIAEPPRRPIDPPRLQEPSQVADHPIRNAHGCFLWLSLQRIDGSRPDDAGRE